MHPSRRRIVLACAFVALAVLLTWVWTAFEAPPEGHHEPPHVAAPVTTDPAPHAAQPTPAPPDRTAPETPFVLPSAGIAGSVRTPLHRTVRGAELVFQASAAGATVELGRARTDASGRYALEADLAAWKGRAARLVVTLRADGFQGKREERVFDDLFARAGAARVLACEFVLDPGQALAGRAVDAEHRPVAGAELVLFASTKRAEQLIELAVARCTSGADGRFELGYTSDGVYGLRARAENAGTALRERLELGVGADRELGDVVLNGPGVLAGVAVHADGTPAAALELAIVPAELADRPDAARIAAATLVGREGGAGLACARATTDASGRFRAAGLALGDYAVVSPRPAVKLARAVHALPAEDVRVVVETPRVCVRVVRADGTPATGVRVACARLEHGADGAPVPGAADWQAPRAPGFLACFAVEPETSYALRAQAGSSAVEDVVILAPGEFELVKELVLPEAGTGSLHLAIEVASGRSPPEVRASLVSALTGDPVDECMDRLVGPDGRLDGLPAGRYRLELAPRSNTDDAWLPVRAAGVLEVRAGRTLEHTVVLLLGARIELELALDGPPPAGFEFRADPRAHPDETAKARAAHEAIHGALVTLAPADGPARALLFEPPAFADDAPSSARGVQSTLLPGRRARASGAWPPGEWTLRVEAAGFAPVERALVLRPGETRSERITLRAQ